jgi:hypothetical protein
MGQLVQKYKGITHTNMYEYVTGPVLLNLTKEHMLLSNTQKTYFL